MKYGLLLFIVLAGVVWMKAPDVIAWGISKQLHAPVTIDSMRVSPNSFTVNDLEIHNPKGSLIPKALVAKSISIHTPLQRFFNDTVVIDEIVIDGLYVSIESHSITDPLGNWSTILGTDPKKSKQKVLIKKLRITTTDVDFVFSLLGSSVHKLPTIDEIELTDISSDENIVKTILNQIVHEVSTGIK